MKRILLFLVLIAGVALGGDFPADIVTNRSQMFTLGIYDPFLAWALKIDGLVGGGSGGIGTGNIYYVDSNVSHEGDGTSWTSAKDTLEEGIQLCKANNGDVIYIAEGHSETMGAAADEVDIDIAGITIIGCGNGDNRPLFDYTDYTTGAFAIGTDDVTISNLRFLANVTDVNEAIEIEAGSARVTISNCLFACNSEGTDEFLECIDSSGGAASDNLHVFGCEFRMGAAASNSAICTKDSDYMIVAGCVTHGDYAVACLNNMTTASNHVLIYGNQFFNGTIGGNTGLNAQPCIELVATTTGMIVDNILVCNVATPDLAIVGADMYIADNWYSESEATSIAPMWLTTDTVDNIFGFNDSDNATSTSSVASNRDGSILERLEFLCKYFETGTPGALVAPANTFSLLDVLGTDGSTTTGAVAGSILGAIGTNEAAANTPFTSSTAESDRDGSVLERLEFLCKYFETGTPGALVAPANTFSILDILGSDGSTTTGAIAGSILGAIGTNETAANTPFSSSTVQSDADGSVLERLEYIQTDLATVLADTGAQDTDAEIGALGSALTDNIQAAMDANSLLKNWTAARAAILSEIHLSAIGDKVQADIDANSTQLAAILADTSAQDTDAEIGALGSTLTDNIQAAMDANSILYWQPRVVSVVADTNHTTVNLFDVAGGPIEILSMYGFVTETLDDNAVSCDLFIDADAPGTDYDLTTSVVITSDAKGTRYVFDSTTTEAVLVPCEGEDKGGAGAMKGWFVVEGMIEQTLTAVNIDGGIRWYMVWRPLASGVTVTVQ